MTQLKFASPVAAQNAARVPSRVHWPDVARGIGIVLVVLGHTIAGLLNAGVMEHTAGPHWVYYAIYTFHMPLFFVLSGIFLADGAKRGAEDFWTGKAWTIVYPYVLWSLTQGALQMWINGTLGQPWTFRALASIGWQPLSQFWFLYALLVCHAAGMALKDRPYVLLGLSLVGWIAASFMPWTWIAAKTLHFLPYYALGMVVSTRALRWRAPPVWVTLGLMVAFGASVAACHALEEWKAESLVVTPAALLGVAATIAVALSAEDAFGAALRWLGRASMTILVLHILALVAIRMALSAMGVDDPMVHLVAGLIFGLLGPAWTHVLLERWGLLPVFGFARPPRRAPVPVTSPSRSG